MVKVQCYASVVLLTVATSCYNVRAAGVGVEAGDITVAA